MSYLGWPHGPASSKQVWLLRKLKLDVLNEGLPADHGYTEGTASAEIKRLLVLQKEREAA